MTSRNDNL